MSLVELLVGLAVGLVVSAAAVAAMAQHAGETRRLLLDARLTQELRTATELTLRHLRRARHWDEAGQRISPPDTPAAAASPWSDNPHTVDTDDPEGWRFSYSSPSGASPSADGAVSHDRFGLRLHDGAIEMALGDGRWQALTDRTLVQVTALQLTPTVQRQPLDGLCVRPCGAGGVGGAPAAGTGECPPRLEVLDVAVRIAVVSLADKAVTREAHTHVRVRNDQVTGRCPS